MSDYSIVFLKTLIFYIAIFRNRKTIITFFKLGFLNFKTNINKAKRTFNFKVRFKLNKNILNF
ncbi:hypothetical protein FFZ99_02855 [Leptospira interrogans]|uniref:Uncharacterized protein n=2 Tax=Leptospira interrogans TaxID=173 RepID=A0A0F6HEX2_LEPIR|nr:hypothetical protein B2G47_03220 [Leptospira interrogans serovar Canicola]EKO26908.1 hypothetical protein LEP1GSC104_1154 [Leptospira interrogans str. UI 12621]EMJ36447.1 hypothetical protein LEP1GSC079_4753 [Leptospira interrogans str. FPW1039]EMN99948.1 hypothetical protein LEP1GSC112_0514 [Leptospira interrogans serovar Pomona str. UT364]OMH69109.1 hypothetical protein BW243_04935 [Leptospira interrogans serovar Pomona]TQE60462.1 hypothetical protein FF006_02495 [Leptospira interrogans]